MLVTGGEKGGVRATEAHRNAETLRRAEGHVGAHRTRRLEQYQRHQVGSDSDDTAVRLNGCNRVGQIGDFAGIVRVLEDRTENFLLRGFCRRAENQLVAEETGTGLDNVDGLREAGGINKEQVGFRPADAASHGHGFGSCSGFVEQRGVRQFEAGKVDDHLLVVEQGFETALGDFSLVGGVSGVPARVFQYVTQDDLGRQGVVIAHADQGLVDLVLAGDGFEFGQGFSFRDSIGQWHGRGQANGCRHGLFDQRVNAGSANGFQHGSDIGL